MPRYKVKNSLSALLFALLLQNTPALFAQTAKPQVDVASSMNSAGFSFAKDTTPTEPLLHYQQYIHMLSVTNDMPSLKIYGDGRVLVHFPVYMKKAGDYEMQFDETELINLIRSLSNNGVMDFDEKKVNADIKASEKALTAKGHFYTISDAVESNVEIKLVQYQKNTTSQKITNFHKTFKWKNIEHDAKRHKQNIEIKNAHKAIIHLIEIMSDARLVKKGQR